LNGITPLITALFTLIGMIWITASIDSQLALVALAVTPFVFVLTNIYRQRLRQRWKTAKRLESSAMSVVQEVFSSLRVVKAFGQESREDDRFVRHSKDSLDSKVSAIWIEGVFNMLLALVIAGGTAAVLYLGIRHIQLGLLSLGEFLLIMGYLGQLYGPIQNLGKQITSLQNGFSSAERAYQLLDESPEVVEHARAVPINQCPGGIVFKDVTFAYPQHEAVIEGMTVNFPAGTIIGIAGKTGEGKSTLVSLILRFYDVDRGQILLDGIDIRDRAIADLRYQFALVLQEPVLFSTSIRENIAYARPGANFAEIIEAAKAAKAHEFIEQLPEGYDTQVGERGMLLSGGQRQRISIARAFLKDAPILILDEPTSSLDVPTENEMLKELSTLMKNRTTLLISHRLSALKMCDQIYVLKKGKLEQVSTVDSAVREMTVKTPDLETIANEKSG
jgi:ATP-binding cassette subfamily B protein